MRRKLLRRMQRQKALISQKDLEEVERRAGSSFRELAMAHHFQHVIVDHDGEDGRTGMLFTSRLEMRAEPSTHSWRCCKASMCRGSSNGKKDLISCTHDSLPLRILNRMKIGYLIQDVS